MSGRQAQLVMDERTIVVSKADKELYPDEHLTKTDVIDHYQTVADAMLPQRRITAGQTLDVVARISLDGQPQSATGDPFGQVSYHVGKDGLLSIVIDKLAP